MNMFLGICVGALVGWIAYRFMKPTSEPSLRSALLIGLLGGGIGAQLAQMFGATDLTGGNFNLISLVTSAASAAACLFASKMIANRGSA